MEIKDIMHILADDMKVAVFATVDDEGKPHARHAHIGVANEQGVFFMTSPKTHFYQQLQSNPHVAITAMKEDGYTIQVIRIEGKAQQVGRDQLQTLLAGNPYLEQVYPDAEERSSVQVFHLYQGQGFYHSLTQGHKYRFEFGQSQVNVQEI
ncbi:pyridoxamine 5'-phosphate oxidase family protein [Vaginisenegalia massiliensis]|uniref:pyridoxamine 5'-phosphate oxidase family protein n=1 Tax=Vaginisenegalia massiliensis TaxID=2058294 RepID=UPI000F536AF1|nr:pyridoxamine 5'-phosphate oxidase family protein [Vaginisenegalia massiliensis]